MAEDSCEMHSEDDKALLEKNKKRIVKTREQVDALEKFYNEHKYPAESMKIQMAESIGLTEKQVSGWFCHRRLKDKKIIKNGENLTTGGRSSGVVQDRTSGHRQDSCGSTKQGEDNRNFETREVESGRHVPKEYSAVDPTYERGSHFGGTHNNNCTEDASSGSSSSLRNMSGHQNGSPFFDAAAAISRYPVPKFTQPEVKSVTARRGPSGYLKLKGQVENASITAVKRQLGKQYREDGPPLGVDFDPLPPGAFESSVQDATEETYDSGEDALPASPDVSKIRQSSKFGKGCEYKRIASNNSEIDGSSFKARRKCDIPNGYIPEKFRVKNSVSGGGAYYPSRNSSVELPENIDRDIPTNPQPYRGKVREERAESWSRKYNDVSTKIPVGENSENEFFNMRMKANQYQNPEDKVTLSRQIIKDGKMYHDRRMVNENRVNIPSKNDFIGQKRIREEFPQQQYLKRSPIVDNLPPTYQVVRSTAEMPSSFSEDEESAETSSSMD
ncbi:hypothetical protein ACP275_14G233500 [Erythranthe tilingii]